ncbi:MATE family efflux transporter [Ruminococcus sp.]|uniref:MATE family efflux transporter n=1 Tax=Ruminococcus sp. TaxID=41978 RepID=UPI0039954D38
MSSHFPCHICSLIFLQTLYGMADLFIIGQFEGKASITAVSVGSQVMHMLTVIIVGLAMGSTVSIAQAVGAGRKKRASRCIGNTITLFLILSILLTILLLFLVNPIVTAMATPGSRSCRNCVLSYHMLYGNSLYYRL